MMVFVISRIITVEVGDISQRLRPITLTKTLIILDITKTTSNNCFIIHWTEKKWKSCFWFFTDSKQHKVCKLDMITLRNHALRSYMTQIPMTLSILDTIIVQPAARWHHTDRHWFRKFAVRFQLIRKQIVSSMYNNKQLLDEVVVLYRIIKVEVGVISRSQRLRLITLSETLIILDITKTECNNRFIIQWTKKIMEVVFLLLH